MERQRLDQSQRLGIALTAGMQQSLHILRQGNRDITELLRSEAERNPFLKVVSGRGQALASDQASAGPSLAEHVASQIRQTIRDPFDLAFAFHVAAAIEPTGWLGRNLNELAEEVGYPREQAETILARLQEFDPPGLFARSLRECLEIQARDAGALSPSVSCVLARLDLLASGKPAKLLAACGISQDELTDIIRLIRSFDPKPGLRFSSDTSSILTADLRITAEGEGWKVELNDSALPAVSVVPVPSGVTGRNRSTVALRELERQARQLERMVSRRKETLLKVGVAIIERQSEFLRKGHIAMLPLSLADISEATGLHQSTVSRAVSATMIDTPKGCLPLRAFFSRPVVVGHSRVAAHGSLEEFVRAIIREEDPGQPLTDDQIAATIKEAGFSITRRTVTNYRKSLGLPTSSARRVQGYGRKARSR